LGRHIHRCLFHSSLPRLWAYWCWRRYATPDMETDLWFTDTGLGTLAAVFQSCMYGGFTPAGGIFATLTSMAMLGTMMPAAAFLASIIATGVAVIVWACGAGR
jgi:hypothetical protein